MRFYEFVCPQGHVTTRRAALGDRNAVCATCGLDAVRRQFHLPYIQGDTVVKNQRQADALLEIASEVDYEYGRAEREMGQSLKRPWPIHAGVVRARAKLLEGGDYGPAREGAVNALERRALGKGGEPLG